MSEKVFAIDDETEAYRLIAHFSTYYGDSKQNRKDNIALAARKIDGLVLYPEDEFSFNDLVGRRTVENGFKTAYVIQTVILSKAWAAEFVKCQALFTTAHCLQTLQ